MLVSFEKIVQVQLGEVTPINSAVSNSIGTITWPQGTPASTAARTNLYDPMWGYFVFGQSLKMDYHDTRTYTDYGQFIIQGEFTANAENALVGSVAPDVDSQFMRMYQNYDQLELYFENAAKAAAPANFSDWGGPNDPRCIPLPQPLVDANGNTVYALPQELTVDESQWGQYVKYTATLREAKFPSAKVMVNQQFIDDGVVTITCPRPIMSRRSIPGTAGEVIQLQNYSMMEFEVQGTVNGQRAAGRSMTNIAADLNAQLQADYVDLGVIRVLDRGATTIDRLWPGLSLDEGSAVDVNFSEQLLTLSIKAKAGKAS